MSWVTEIDFLLESGEEFYAQFAPPSDIDAGDLAGPEWDLPEPMTFGEVIHATQADQETDRAIERTHERMVSGRSASRCALRAGETQRLRNLASRRKSIPVGSTVQPG